MGEVNNLTELVQVATEVGKKQKSLKNNKSLSIFASDEYINSNIGRPKEFLIDRLIPQNSLGLLVAPAKTNKTTIAYKIALSVAEGMECIGHTTNIRGKVLYINIEGSLHGLIETFGISKNIDIVPNKFFQWEDYKDSIIEAIKEKEYKLIIIDPLYKATKRNIAVAGEIRNFLIELEEIANSYNCTFLLCHHTMRGNTIIKEKSTDDIAGSMHIVRAMEFTLMLEKEEKTEEEIQLEENMSIEEFEALPQKRILRKMDYRYGGEGYTKYSINIDFKNQTITGERYKSVGQRVQPKARIEDLYNHSVEILRNYPVITKSILAKELSKLYDLSEKTIQNRYISKVWEQLEIDNRITRERGYNYQVVKH